MSQLGLKLIKENKEKHNKGRYAKFLDLGSCGLHEIPEEIKECIWLEELNLMRPIEKIKNTLQGDGFIRPDFWKGSPPSIHLNVEFLPTESEWIPSETIHYRPVYSTINDLKPLTGLINLKTLNCSYSKVEDLSPILPLIKKGIPVKWEDEGTGILVKQCPLIHPPLEVVRKGNTAIINYLEERENRKQFKNTEVKLIIVGNATTGKTSLSKYLREQTYTPGQPTTHGIRNDRWLPIGKKIQINCWDFGGQEYFHATHRLFLSRNAVYLLVWDSKTDIIGFSPTEIFYEKDPKSYTIQLEHFPKAWWLKNIRQYTYESNPSVPIIMVQNKCALDGIKSVSQEFQKSPFNLDWSWLHNHIDIEAAASYKSNPRPNTQKWQRKFEDFEEILLETLENQLGNYEFSFYHSIIRDRVRELAKQGETKMRFAEFEKLCLEIEPEAKMDLVEIYLQDITGDILYYKKNQSLSDWVFINPSRVCEQIYRILSRQVKSKNGIFSRAWVCESLECGQEESNRILALMQEFELVFEETDESGNPTGNFVAPQYLPEFCIQPGELTGAKKFANLTHGFTLWFVDFLPKSHIARFVANWGSQASQSLFWKNGLLFQTAGCTVLVERIEELKIRADFQIGNDSKKRTAFQRVFQTFLKIEEGPASFAVSINGKDFALWQSIEDAVQMGASYVKSYDPLGQTTFLDLKTFSNLIPVNTVAKKIFISYSKSDEIYLIEFKAQLISLQRQGLVEIWDDSNILPGKEWDSTIRRELKASDIIVLLVSPNLIATDYIWEVEIKEALERHERGEVVVVPVIIRPCIWDNAPFGKLNALPTKGTPISIWKNRDEAWKQVVTRIKQLLE